MEQDWNAIKDDLNQWNNHNKLISRGSECINTMDALDRLRALDAAKDKEIIRLREALAFYSNPNIYKPHPHGPAFDNRDLSYHAVKALKPDGVKA